MATISFKEQVKRAREDAIVAAAHRLLAEKGFEVMTVDEIAQEVGIAKASLYKHFESKELLAAEAMVRVMAQGQAFMDTLTSGSAMDKLKAVARWAIQTQLAGQMPLLPAQNSSLRETLTKHEGYLKQLFEVSERLGAWILSAQQEGDIAADMPPEVVLYNLFARACDPVVGVLKATGQYDDEAVANLIIRTTFEGLSRRG